MDWIHSAKEGWCGEEDDVTKKSHGGGTMGSDGGVRIYAQENPICQLLGDGELGWKTIGE